MIESFKIILDLVLFGLFLGEALHDGDAPDSELSEGEGARFKIVPFIFTASHYDF